MTDHLNNDGDVDVGGENIDGFANRVDQLIKSHGSAGELAKRAGVSESVVRKWRSGQSDPRRSHLVALASAANVSLEWLATGCGEIEKGAVVPNSQHGVYSFGDFVMVPRYNVHVSAGHGALAEEERIDDHLAFRTEWVRQEMGLNPAALVLVTVRGDSMEPTLRHGDTLLVDTSQKVVTGGSMYVLRWDGQVFAKRLQRLHDGSIRISSDNQAYADEVVDPAEFQLLDILGRIVWTGRQM